MVIRNITTHKHTGKNLPQARRNKIYWGVGWGRSYEAHSSYMAPTSSPFD